MYKRQPQGYAVSATATNVNLVVGKTSSVIVVNKEQRAEPVSYTHLHQTWECYLADDNGSNEVEVTRIRDVDTLNVTLTSGNLMSICQDRLGFFQKELFSAYNDTKGNLQMLSLIHI